MTIQGMGLIETKISPPVHHAEQVEARTKSVDTEKATIQDLDKKKDSLLSEPNIVDLQKERAKLQQLLQNQKKASKLMKHLLFLITPGMQQFVDNERDNSEIHLQAKA